MTTNSVRRVQCLPLALCALATGLVAVSGCSRKAESGVVKPGFKKMAAGQEYSGFLSDYGKLAHNARLDGEARSYVRADAAKNLHKYVAVIVEPVEVYLATDVDEKNIPDNGRTALAQYFQSALTAAVSDAFPVVTEANPLVLRLRTAIVGIDAGAQNAGDAKSADGEEALARSLNIGKVAVEMELVDSTTGDQIAAFVDREPLGAGAEVGAVNFSRYAKFVAAREAFDGWARRVRDFMDSAHELSAEDAKRASTSYQPYGAPSN